MREGRTFDAALDRAVGGLGEADRRLAHELAAGVLRQQTALDDGLARLVRRGLAGTGVEVRDCLRLGAYQLSALDRVPAHAAVNTSVALARERGGSRAAGFANAVLRRFARSPAASAADASAADASAAEAALAQQYSHPEWLVARWLARFGTEDTARLLRWNNTRPRLVLQPARRGLKQLSEGWRAAGIRSEPAPYGAGLVTDRSRPDELPGYETGDFIVQDPAQALLTWYADLPPGAVIYDACAAPGGKSIALGREADLVLSADVSARRVGRLAQNVRRAGSGREHPVVADLRRPPLREAGVVLLDAPCLGTGTFARHPDARWRVTPDQLAALEALQGELLERAAGTVAPGGLLLYSTCSLEPEENERQVARLLGRHAEFRREPSETFPSALLSAEGDLLLLPHRHGMGGAYAARLRRVG